MIVGFDLAGVGFKTHDTDQALTVLERVMNTPTLCILSFSDKSELGIASRSVASPSIRLKTYQRFIGRVETSSSRCVIVNSPPEFRTFPVFAGHSEMSAG